MKPDVLSDLREEDFAEPLSHFRAGLPDFQAVGSIFVTDGTNQKTTLLTVFAPVLKVDAIDAEKDVSRFELAEEIELATQPLQGR